MVVSWSFHGISWGDLRFDCDLIGFHRDLTGIEWDYSKCNVIGIHWDLMGFGEITSCFRSTKGQAYDYDRYKSHHGNQFRFGGT